MKYRLGYSLIEVLLALMLVSSTALALIKHQHQSKSLLYQLLAKTDLAQAIQRLGEVKVKT